MKKTSILILGLFIISGIIAQNQVGKKLPNIIYIYADDLGYGDLGCYGQEKIKTPNIDKLAAEGIRFTQHYAGSAVCSPSRCMLLTGKNAGHAVVRGNYELGNGTDANEGGQFPLSEGIATLPKLLKNAGYTTAMVGKWGLGMNNNSGSPLKQGFDYYYGFLDQAQAHNYYPTHLWENDKKVLLNNPKINVHRPLDSTKATDKDFDYYKGSEYAPELMTKKALAFIEKNKQKTFYLYLPYTMPHVSLQAPDAYVEKYKGQFEERPYYGQRHYASTKYPMATYAALITYLDDQVGIVMQKIKDLGLENNTIIMFSSDNGPSVEGGANPVFFNSAGGLRGFKRDLYEGGIREPFIVRWKSKIKPGQTNSLVSTQVDLMATFADLTNQKIKNNEGISLLPEILSNNKINGKQKQHQYLYFEFAEKGGSVAIRMGDWKGVKNKMIKNKNAKWELYNLKTDRNETTDVSAQHPEIIKKLDEIAKKEHTCTHVKDWEFICPDFNVKNDG